MPKSKWLVAAAIWILTLITLCPVLLHWPIPPPRISRSNLAIELQYPFAILLCYCFFRAEVRTSSRSKAFCLVLLVFLLTSFINNVHSFNVDETSRYFGSISDAAWQENLQKLVVQLSPGAVPHSYRFLPNAIVFWMQLGRVRFDVARDVYRLFLGLLLFYALYRYARLYTNYLGAILAMLLVAAVFPITFEWYAGQLTDPLSHLSFVLAFIFLETQNFPLLLTTLLVGSLAKETILAMAGFYVLFCRRENRYLFKACVLCMSGAAVYLGVRLLVLKGTMQFNQISGVPYTHVVENWTDPKWPALFLTTACAYLPFLILGWKETPASLKKTVFYLLPVLFVSSLVFSWLTETRNFMPLVFVLAVLSARYLSRHSGEYVSEPRDQERLIADPKI